MYKFQAADNQIIHNAPPQWNLKLVLQETFILICMSMMDDHNRQPHAIVSVSVYGFTNQTNLTASSALTLLGLRDHHIDRLYCSR